jgi:hypothetical protein
LHCSCDALTASHTPRRGVTTALRGNIETHIDKDPDGPPVSLSFFIEKHADVLMSHGCADKGYHLRERHHAQLLEHFKYVLVPGPWLKDKIVRQGVPAERVIEVGWPMNDHLFPLPPRPAKRFLPGNVTVLWAPSHDFDAAGQSMPVSSYPGFRRHVRTLEAAGISVITSPHPRNRVEKSATSERYAGTDWVIADFGSTIYEAWQLGIPVLFLDWMVRDGLVEKMRRQAAAREWSDGRVPSAEQLVYGQQIGVHCMDMECVLRVLTTQPPVLGDDVRDFMANYLPETYSGVSGRRIAEVLAQLAITINSTPRITMASTRARKAAAVEHCDREGGVACNKT